jgi:serine/threonine protein kinase
MSTFTAQPGTRLAGRYRLDDRVRETGGSTLWKAVDETLARPVAVRTFEPGFARVREVVMAARAASRMTDSRLAQVFDVEDGAGQPEGAFIVYEWVPGDGLDDLLSAGPMDPGRAAGLVAEAADALSVAHAAGLAHLCLTPDSLRWAPGSGVKITGLGVDAALAAVTSDDPAAADTRGLGRLLYAAITACWPGGPDETVLPPAPVADGLPRSPRQVRAGVPAGIDAVTCEALFGRPRRGQPPLTTPALLADALAEAAPHAPLTPPPPPAWPEQTAAMQQTGYPYTTHYGDRHSGPPGTGMRPVPGTAPHGMPPTRRPLVGRAVASIVILLVIAAIGVGAWSLGRNLGSHPGRSGPTRGQQTPVAAATTLKPVNVTAFGPHGTGQGDNPGLASSALGGDAGKPWQSDWYTTPRFGNLQQGTGLLLDMGTAVRLSSLQVALGSATGADVSIKMASSGPPSAVDGFTTVTRASGIGGTYTFPMNHAPGRYVLIWFTKLPPGGSGGQFQADVYNIVLHGSS